MTAASFRNSPVRPTREANIGLPRISSNNQELKYASITIGHITIDYTPAEKEKSFDLT